MPSCDRCGAEVEQVTVRGKPVAIDVGPGSLVQVIDLRSDGASVFGEVVIGRRAHVASCVAVNVRAPKAPSIATPTALVEPIVELVPDEMRDSASPVIRANAADLGRIVRNVLHRGQLRSLRGGLRRLARALAPLTDTPEDPT